MRKIVINLNPKKEQNYLFYVSLNYYKNLVLVLLSIILFILLIIFLIRLNSYKSYKIRWEKEKNKFETIDRLKKEISELEKQKKELEKIVTPQNQLALLLRDIFSSLPKNIWFENLVFKKNNLSLKGYIVRWKEDYLASLESFINSLKNKQYFYSKFKKVNIKDSQKIDFRGVEVLEFNIECLN